jgi:hypothetical protein
MKRAVLSGGILFLSILSVAQVPGFYKSQTTPVNFSVAGNQNKTVSEWYTLQPVYLQRALVISNAPDSPYWNLAPSGIIKLNYEISNPITGRGNNVTIHNNIEYVPNLSKVWGNPVIWKISQRGLFLIFPGQAHLISGNYFVSPKSNFDNYAPVFQDPKGNFYSPVPGWRKGQYLPILNSGFTSGLLEWH